MGQYDHPVYYRPDPAPIGWDAGGPPDEPEHHVDCEVHAYCDCPCGCHDEESYHPEDRYIEEVYDAG